MGKSKQGSGKRGEGNWECVMKGRGNGEKRTGKGKERDREWGRRGKKSIKDLEE